MIESVAGFISAAPTPWTVRAAISDLRSAGKAAARATSAVKITSPTMKISRRPKRSASFPPVSSSTPNVSAYALTTHSSPDGADAQVVLDRRQRDVHHRVVEHDHEEPERDGGERPPLAGSPGRRAEPSPMPRLDDRHSAFALRLAVLFARGRRSSDFVWRPDAERVEQRERRRGSRAASGSSATTRSTASPSTSRTVLAGRGRRPRARVLASRGSRCSTRRAASSGRRGSPAASSTSPGTASTAGRSRSTPTRRRPSGQAEDGTRTSLTWRELSDEVFRARRRARVARDRRRRRASGSSCRCRRRSRSRRTRARTSAPCRCRSSPASPRRRSRRGSPTRRPRR